MLNPRHIASSHEDIFIERYQWMRSQALRLAENDREMAEDLVQEAFVHFTLARPDLRTMINLEGYLYSMLRNLHRSQERRAGGSRLQQLSIFEYDTLALGLERVSRSVDRLQVQDQLRHVCHYSSVRKETARAASFLILRFFHGYYPSEIALIGRTNRRAVDERLRIARNEARLYLDDPRRLSIIGGGPLPSPPPPAINGARDIEDVLRELRLLIFRSREGDCFLQDELEEIYKGPDGPPVQTKQLAHITSCRNCLEAVNNLLGLSSLDERNPPDMIGKDSQPKGPSNSVGGGAGSGGDMGANRELLNKYRRRAREVFEHRPQELYFKVNGLLLGSQRINSELNEQTLAVSLSEEIGFVEVCSEQDVRLFFLNVEPPPRGDARQPARVELSDGRSLDLTLSFNNNWPTLHAVYHDPLMKADLVSEELTEEARLPHADDDDEQQSKAWQDTTTTVWRRFGSYMKRLLSQLAGSDFWWRPGLITSALALVVICALVFVKMRAPGEDAGKLLQSSITAEEKLSSNADLVFHRRIRFEEWADGGNRLLARNRVEVWQSAARDLRVRRVYDEQDRLVAGEWIKGDGTSTLYSHNRAPQERTAPSVVARALLETGEIWRLDPSAKDFAALVESLEGATAKETPGAFTIEYSSPKTASTATALSTATVTIRKADLRVVEMRLRVVRGTEAREYRFREELFEKYPKSHVGRSFFLPETELLETPVNKKQPDESKAQTDAIDSGSSTTPAIVASRELEIEVTYLLNRIKANLGEQISLTRTTGGVLRVEALVETEARKEEILRALGPVLRNPAVVVQLSTVDEAVGRRQGKAKQNGVTEREVEIESARIPADADLRRYFAAQGSVDAVDEKINQFASRMMNHSRQALLHASALKNLVEKFSPEDMYELQPEARAKWLAMIREHADACRRELNLLRQGLRPVFAPATNAEGEPSSAGDAIASARRLLQLSYGVDDAVRSAFTISAGGTKNVPVRSTEFWRSIATAEKAAASIQSSYRK